jgi:hypothetical protein
VQNYEKKSNFASRTQNYLYEKTSITFTDGPPGHRSTGQGKAAAHHLGQHGTATTD